MKQVMLVVTGVFAISTFGCSQRVTEKDLPEPVKTSFSKAYDSPGKVKWEKENKNEYEASFDLNGKEISVVYSSAGILQETETEITIADLPVAITDYIAKNYKNAKIDEASKIIKKNGSIIFEAELNKKDLLFDGSGKFLKTDD